MSAALKVEIAFDSGPYDIPADEDWTDVTDFVRSDGGTRGRTFELDKVQTGTRTIVLDNTDGRFTAGRDTSPAPYLGNIKPRRPVRVSIVVGSTAYPRIYGVTDKWTTKAPGGGEYAEATLTVVDALDEFSRLPLSTPYRMEVLKDDPIGYWPMTAPINGTAPFGAAEGSIAKHSQMPLYVGAHRGATDAATFNPSSLLTATDDVVKGDGSYQSYKFGTLGGHLTEAGVYMATQDANLLGFPYQPFLGISNVADYSFELWLTFPSESTPGEVYFVQLDQARTAPAFAIMADGDTGDTISIRWYTADDGSSWEEYDLPSTVRNAKASSEVNYAPEPHHIVVTHTGLTRASWGPQLVYLDGVLVTTKDLTGERAVSASLHYIGGALLSS